MRIAVCRPQVPFAHGGAEIFTDTLVERAPRARSRGGDRLGPVQVVPRRPRAHAGVPLAAARPDRGGRQADRHGRRDEVPVLCRSPPREARLARPPVPAGVRARPDRARPVRRDARGPRAAAEGAGARPRLARRGDAALRHLAATSPAGSSARPGSSPRCCRIRRRSSPTATTGHGDFVLSVEPARPRQADRPARSRRRRSSRRSRS